MALSKTDCFLSKAEILGVGVFSPLSKSRTRSMPDMKSDLAQRILRSSLMEVGAGNLVAPYRAILRYYRCDTTYRAILFKGG